MHHILLVDDEDIFRETLKEYLSFENYQITDAANGQEALDLIQSGKRFDLIVSDVQMPKMSGVEFLKSVKETSKTPFVLMTGYASILETKSAYDLGADDFISKPFKCDELMLIVKKILPEKVNLPIHEEIINKEKSSYIEIPIWSVVTQEHFDMEVFIKLGHEKFLKIIKPGQKIDIERLTAYQKKGLKALFIKDTDALSWNKKIEQERQKKLQEVKDAFLYGIEHIIRDLPIVKKMSPQDSQLLRKNISSTMTSIYESGPMMKLLEDMKNHSNDLCNHSLSTMVYSLLIAREFGLNNDQELFNLGIASLFHDIGEMKIDKTLLDKPHNSLTPIELKLLEEHVFNSWSMVETIPDINQDILRLISEHHENELGTGYPQKISSTQLHPLSKILSASSSLSKMITQGHKHFIISESSAINIMFKRTPDAYSRDVLLALEKIVLTQSVTSTAAPLTAQPPPSKIHHAPQETDSQNEIDQMFNGLEKKLLYPLKHK